MSRLLSAMSGGVDSAVAAALALQQGHSLVGVYMKNWINEDNIVGNCPWQQDIEDARASAEKLGIEFRVVNLMNEYRSKVVDYLLREYQQGLTPNPDVMCNREIKFGVLMQYALEHGFEGVVTGHYARAIRSGSGVTELWEGVDKNKDQSYFLALLEQHQLARAHFPVGDIAKPRVRELAVQFDLPVASKKDSQGICFIGQVKMSDFLQAYVPSKSGNIVDAEGRVLGEHRGLHFYTIGQRKGIRVASNQHQKAYVVVRKDGERNELVVAFDGEDAPFLYTTHCTVCSLSFTQEPLTETMDLLVRPRYRAPAVPAKYKPMEDATQASITFATPQRAIASGQICALYQGERLLGGGVFC